MSLPKSILYNFLSEKYGLSAHFLEGSKLINDLYLRSDLKAQGLAYIRDLVLSIQALTSFLAPDEGFGLYIDSEVPYFRFKIEANQSGHYRTLLLPHGFDEFPAYITGICRLTKTFQNDTQPYTSIIQLEQTPFRDVLSKILSESYQISGVNHLSTDSDQSLLLVSIPPRHLKHFNAQSYISAENFWEEKKVVIKDFFKQASLDRKSIIEFFSRQEFTYLGEKEMRFYCPCSREKMIEGLKSLELSTQEDLFQDQDSIETKCDYCQTYYLIVKSDLE
jgi:molecular chaperone Hsp33